VPCWSVSRWRRPRPSYVDAFVLTATQYDDPRIEWLAQERIPFVAFGRPWGAEQMDDPHRLWVDVDGSSRFVVNGPTG